MSPLYYPGAPPYDTDTDPNTNVGPNAHADAEYSSSHSRRLSVTAKSTPTPTTPLTGFTAVDTAAPSSASTAAVTQQLGKLGLGPRELISTHLQTFPRYDFYTHVEQLLVSLSRLSTDYTVYYRSIIEWAPSCSWSYIGEGSRGEAQRDRSIKASSCMDSCR